MSLQTVPPDVHGSAATERGCARSPMPARPRLRAAEPWLASRRVRPVCRCAASSFFGLVGSSSGRSSSPTQPRSSAAKRRWRTTSPWGTTSRQLAGKGGGRRNSCGRRGLASSRPRPRLLRGGQEAPQRQDRCGLVRPQAGQALLPRAATGRPRPGLRATRLTRRLRAGHDDRESPPEHQGHPNSMSPPNVGSTRGRCPLRSLARPSVSSPCGVHLAVHTENDADGPTT